MTDDVCTTEKPPNQLHRLKNYLLNNQTYSSSVRPVFDIGTATDVKVRLSLLNILSLDERAEILTMTVKLYIEWKDEYLTWDPRDFGGLTATTFPQNDVWKPDIILENSVDSYDDMGADSLNVVVKSDGSVLWKTMEVIHSTCTVNVERFPMDTQRCSLYFESWTHSADNIRLYNGSSTVQIHGYDGHPEWSISDTKAERKLIRDDVYIIFHLTFTRKCLYALLNVWLPIILLSLLCDTVFLIPADCGEKASFSITVFLSLSVFLTIVSEQLPRTSDNVSVFNVYVFVQVTLSTVITILTSIQLRIHCKYIQSEVPHCLQRLVRCCRIPRQGNCQTKMVLGDFEHRPNGETLTESEASKEDEIAADKKVDNMVTWEMVGDLMDPICFVIFLILNVGSTLILLTYLITHMG